MCLAIPMKLLSRGPDDRGVGEIGGVSREVMLTLTPDAQVGQYLMVHTGWALEILDESEVEKTLELLRSIAGDSA